MRVSFLPDPSVGVNEVESRWFNGVFLSGGQLMATLMTYSPNCRPSVFITACAASDWNRTTQLRI